MDPTTTHHPASSSTDQPTGSGVSLSADAKVGCRARHSLDAPKARADAGRDEQDERVP